MAPIQEYDSMRGAVKGIKAHSEVRITVLLASACSNFVNSKTTYIYIYIISLDEINFKAK